MSSRPKITEDFSFDDLTETVETDVVVETAPEEKPAPKSPRKKNLEEVDGFPMGDVDDSVTITEEAAPPAPAAPAEKPKGRSKAKPEPEPVAEEPAPSPALAPVPEEVLPETGTDKVKSESCSFQIDADKFGEYLDKIVLVSLVDDAYVLVKADSLFCAYCDKRNEGLTGFVQFSDGIRVTKTGAFILPKVAKVRNVVNQFSGTVEVSYADGFVKVKSTTSKKYVQILGYDSGYVNSLRGINLNQISLGNFKVGTYCFKDDIRFQIGKGAFDELVKGAHAIELTSFKFSFKKDQPTFNVLISNFQDEFAMELAATQHKIDKNLDVTFLLGGMKEVLKNVCDTLTVWVNDTFMMVNSGTDYFMFMAVEE